MSRHSLPPLVQIREAALELGYQPDETFCLKISQLRELVRGGHPLAAGWKV